MELAVHCAVSAMSHRGLEDSAAWVTGMFAGATNLADVRADFELNCRDRPPRGFIVIDTADGTDIDIAPDFSDNPGRVPSMGLLYGRALLAKKEFRRCINALRAETGDEGVFIRHYAWYLDGERQAMFGLDSSGEVVTHGGMTTYEGSCPPHEVPPTARKNPYLPELLRSLGAIVVTSTPDGANDDGNGASPDQGPSPTFESEPRHRYTFHNDPYLCWLYGVVTSKSGMHDIAIQAFAAAVTMEPLFWAAWKDLSVLVKSEAHIAEMVDALRVECACFPWTVAAFAATSRLALHLVPAAQHDIGRLMTAFPESGFVHQLHAQSLSLVKDYEGARNAFTALRSIDPYRLEGLDDFSNVLFVLNDRRSLSALSLDVFTIDPFRAESNCVAGNLYALLRQHDKSLLHFRRAVSIDPTCVSAWTLMGHEYLEVRNTSASVEAYRASISLDERDYRAWYGLGQIYELLQLFQYALHYYRQTTVLRPNDSRMWIATAGCLERLRRPLDAAACLERAAQCEPPNSDAFALTMRRAAQHYSTVQPQRAAACYRRILDGTRRKAEDIVEAQLFLSAHLAKQVVSLLDSGTSSAPPARAPSFDPMAHDFGRMLGSTGSSGREQQRPSLATRRDQAAEMLRESESLLAALAASLGPGVPAVQAREIEVQGARRLLEVAGGGGNM